MEIYLIRHGECFHSSEEYFDESKKMMNPPLTEKGREQARELYEKLKNTAFDRIYCSDLERAVQTAGSINNGRKTEIIKTPAFREVYMGEREIKTWESFPDLYREWALHETDVPYPQGECGMDVWKRCKKELDAIMEQDFQRVAIVCHGGTIRVIISGVLGLLQQKRFNIGYDIHNCSVSIIVKKENLYLQTFNDYNGICD